jgi:hypothetical protein
MKSSKLSSYKLCDAHPKAPVCLGVLSTANYQIFPSHGALFPQIFRQRFKYLLLLHCIPALLQDMDDHEPFGTMVPQIGILTDDLVIFVLGDDLDVV